MRRRLDWLLPALVLTGSLATAVAVNLLLVSAQERGVDALEQSVDGEVRAIAGNQNQRFVNTFSGAAGLVNPPNRPYTLDEGDPGDLAALESFLTLIPNARSGFYLVDDQGTITQGVQLMGDAVGARFEWPGFDELVATPSYQQGTGGVLPVSDGITTGEPVVAFVFPILDPRTGMGRGHFVFESVVAVDSDFNKEIGSLRRGETGVYAFFDTAGSVIASNDVASIGRPLADDRVRSAPLGVHRFDDAVVVVADVPSAGWRVAFRQDAEEFERSLSRPLQSAGVLLVVALLGAGALLTILLYRRLRASRAEQQRLEALAESQREFISIVSHELRTPVAGVLGFLETSLDHWDAMDDGERKGAVSRAATNARRLQAMTRDVLDTETVETGRLIHVLGRLDLAAEVRVAVEAARDVDDDQAIELRLPPEPVWVHADADRLQQVLGNLIENARKNSPAVEPIEVEVRMVAEGAEVLVADRGPGIAEESLERIFEKFVRGRGNEVSGTGLGLYIARRIMDAHGGRVWAESAPGTGATFHVSLPVVDVEAAKLP